MDRNEIIKKIHQDGKILEVCKNIGKQFADDLYQEVLLRLLLYDKLELVYEQAGDSFNYFVIKIINSVFIDEKRKQKKNRNIIQLNHESEKHKKIQFEVQLSKIEKAIIQIDKDCRENKIYPLGGNLFKIYLDEKSIRKVAIKTNIHRNHIHKEITNYKKEVLKVYKQL